MIAENLAKLKSAADLGYMKKRLTLSHVYLCDFVHELIKTNKKIVEFYRYKFNTYKQN